MTTTRVMGFLRSRWRRRSRTPTQKATVFPEPVADEATMSLPSMASGMHSAWMGVGVERLRDWSARSSWRESVQDGSEVKERGFFEGRVDVLRCEVKKDLARAASAADVPAAAASVSASDASDKSDSLTSASAAKPLGAAASKKVISSGRPCSWK